MANAYLTAILIIENFLHLATAILAGRVIRICIKSSKFSKYFRSIIIIISVTTIIYVGISSISRIVNYISDPIYLRDVFLNYGESFFITVFDFGILTMLIERLYTCLYKTIRPDTREIVFFLVLWIALSIARTALIIYDEEVYSDRTYFGIIVLTSKLLICFLATVFIISRSRELRKQRKDLDKALKDKYIISENLQINKVIIPIALVNIVQRFCLIIFQILLYLIENYTEAVNSAERVTYSAFMLYTTLIILHGYNRLTFSKSIHNSVADEGLSKSERVSKTTDMHFTHLNRIWNSVP